MPNPLNLSLASSVQERTEKVKAEIVDLDELEEMSLTEVNQAKIELEKKRQRIQLSLDGRKLEQAKNIVQNMEMILSAMATKLMSDDVPAADVKFLASAYTDMLKNLNNISRLDSVDGRGTAQMIHIEVRTQG